MSAAACYNHCHFTMPRSFHILTGPTAAGKTGFLLDRSRDQTMLVVSADSRQVYRMLDIGTGKASDTETALLPHYGVDFLELGTKFSVYQYLIRTAGYLRELRDDPRMVWICGGTGLYIHALLSRLELGQPPREALRRRLSELMARDGAAHWAARLSPAVSDPHNPIRVMRAVEERCSEASAAAEIYRAVELAADMDEDSQLVSRQEFTDALSELELWQCDGIAVLDPGREALLPGIERRVRWMFDNGLVEELQRIRAAGYGKVAEVASGIAYREAGMLLDGELSREEAITTAVIRTRQYAKRQRTYFRGRGWPFMDLGQLAIWFDGLTAS